MIRDSFHRQILQHLSESLDGNLFQTCANALLRPLYPTLVEIPGGKDGGIDGALADNSIRLVCTTQKNVKANLTKSLNSILRHGDQPGPIILATSRELSRTQRDKLAEAARKLGFTITQFYDQAAMAELLYDSPRWCKELLGLSGRPQALSSVLATSRPLLNATLVGRDEDLRWLQQTSGDRLIAGTPGSGKTFLLTYLTQQGWGYFLTGIEIDAIASAIREYKPSIIVVDDAGERLDHINQLRQIRKDIGADFTIVATCWENEQEHVQAKLGLPSISVHQLPLLTRDEIAQVIHESGLTSPPQVVQEIVVQAEGRPGLAVTLTHLWLQGDRQDVLWGQALTTQLITFFRHLVGEDVATVLAYFSLGGNEGLEMVDVATAMGMPVHQLRTIVRQLAAGGVIREVSNSRLAVYPLQLRHHLVANTFFSGATSLSYESVSTKLSGMRGFAQTLVGAAESGADVPGLVEILESTADTTAWCRYAFLGREQCRYVVRTHPKLIRKIHEAALHYIPSEVLPILFNTAIGDNRSLHNSLDHPLRWVEDWIKSIPGGQQKAVSNRQVLLDAVTAWFETAGDENVATRVIAIAMLPVFEVRTLVPGSGNSLQLTSGTLRLTDIEQFDQIWQRSLSLLGRMGDIKWKIVLDIVHTWVHPTPIAFSDDKYRKKVIGAMRAVAKGIIRELIPLIVNHPGMQQELRKYARTLKMDIMSLPREREYEILFPETNNRRYDQPQAAHRKELAMLIDEWSREEIETVATRLVRLQSEANAVEKSWPSYLEEACSLLAERALQQIDEWLDVLWREGAPSNLIEPFLLEAVRARSPRSVEMLSRAIASPGHLWSVVAVALTIEGIDPLVLDQISEYLPKCDQYIQALTTRNQVPHQTLVRLLQHPDHKVVNAAVVGHWWAGDRAFSSLPEETRALWREAVLMSTLDTCEEHSLFADILKKEPDIALEWLLKHVGEVDFLIELPEHIITAVDVLDSSQKEKVLTALQETQGAKVIARYIVGADCQMYRFLLSQSDLHFLHPAPLWGVPDAAWGDKAQCAFEHGYSILDVCAAMCRIVPGTYWGPESEMWSERKKALEPHLDHSDPKVIEAASLCIKTLQQQIDACLQRERKREVFGDGE